MATLADQQTLAGQLTKSDGRSSLEVWMVDISIH